jgi:regulator of replication initiation timing
MLIRNYEDLEHRRQQLTKIEKIDSDRKGKLCEAFANKLLLDVKRSYYAKIMKWRITRRLRHKLQTTAEAQFASSTKDMRTQYYWKLSKFLQLNKDKRRKAELGTALMKSTENGLYGAYLKNLLEFARRSHDAERRRVLGASLATSTQRGLVRIFYTNLQRYADRQRQKKRRDVITQAILRSSDAGVMGVYWKAIGNYIKSQKEAANKNKLGETLFRSTTQGLLRLYYTKLAVRAKKNIDRKKRSDIAEAMMRSSDFGLLSVFYKKLIRYPAVKQATPLENQYADLNKRIKEMEELLASRAFMTEAELEAELKRRAAELEKIQAGNSDLDAEIKALEIENRKLRMDLRRENYLDPTKTLPEQLEQAMYLLKARGVNCLADFTEVTEVHGHSAAEANKLFDGGIVKVQKVFTKVVLPEKLKEDPSTPVWYAPPEAMDKIKRTKKYMDAAVEGIVDIVVAYDMMTFEKRDSWFTEDGFTHEHRKKAEVVNNCNCFLEVVMEHFKKVHEVKVLPKGHPKATPGAKAPAGSPKKAKPKSARKPKAAASPDSPNESPRDTPRDEDAENAASPASPGTADEASPPRITSPPIDDASPGAAASPADSKVKKVRKSKIYLGLVVSDVPAPKGVLLKEVVEGGPAAVAGLKVGDAIVSFGGTAVKTNKASFNAAVTTSAVAGKEVSIGYLRGTSSGSTKLIVGSK